MAPQRFYAVLRGRQPGVYSERMSAQAQVRCYTNSYLRAFASRDAAEEWLETTSGQRYPYYQSLKSITRTHRIYPRSGKPDADDIYVLHCDGASRGNPGPSGCGGFITAPPRSYTGDLPRMAQYQHYFGHATNNVAEWRGLARGLVLARGLGIRHIRVQCDSELVVLQSCGQWATQQPVMSYYRDIVQALLHEFDWWELTAVRREHNSHADRLANAAIDKQIDGEVLLDGGNVNYAVHMAARVRSVFQQSGLFKAQVTIANDRQRSEPIIWAL